MNSTYDGGRVMDDLFHFQSLAACVAARLQPKLDNCEGSAQAIQDAVNVLTTLQKAIGKCVDRVDKAKLVPAAVVQKPASQTELSH